METGEQKKNTDDRPWLWKKGQSGNPSGRPKGRKSMKQWVKEKLEAMGEEERDEFLNGLPKEIVWKMAEGNPQTNTDLTSGGKPLPTSINVNFTKYGDESST